VLSVDVPPALVRGDVDEGYGPVADAFRRNFAERGEIGAACAVYRDGRKVVDLWGGYRDGETRAEWCADTVVVMFSTTKGVSSLALALAHSRGLFDYDAPVAAYWPEFAWRGKAAITVRQLLSHQAGLPVLDIPLTIADLADLDLVAAVLALQQPLWAPGTRHGYHGITLGWYESELLRRVEPASRSLGRFFAEEIAAPLGLDFWIGLPEGFEFERRATVHGRGPWESLVHFREFPRGLLLAMMRPGSITRRAFGNPRELLVDVNLNRPDVLAVEIPAANGIGEARAVAAAYSAAVTGELGLSDETLAALVCPAAPPSGGVEDLVLRAPTSFSLGNVKPMPGLPFGSSANAAFGTPGNGGSFGFADPDTGVGYCYAPNRLGFGLVDEREIALRDALYHDVLGERPQRPA
jgi:CubicO group peptidase (beta-lactamase class C family)